MADKFPKYHNQMAQDEHDNSDEPYAKRVILWLWDVTNLRKVRARANSDGSLSLGGLSLPLYDYVAVAYPDGDTEIYTFKTGGSGGTTVATVTINYTDTTKEYILNVART